MIFFALLFSFDSWFIFSFTLITGTGWVPSSRDTVHAWVIKYDGLMKGEERWGFFVVFPTANADRLGVARGGHIAVHACCEG